MVKHVMCDARRINHLAANALLMFVCEARADRSKAVGMSQSEVLDRHCPESSASAPAMRGARAAVELAVYDRLEDIEAEWRRFESTADCSGFQAFDWLAQWCRSVGPHMRARTAIVAGRRDDGTLLFLFPLAVIRGAVSRVCDGPGVRASVDWRCAMRSENRSLENNKVLLTLLLAAWARLTPGQRQGVARIVDLFVNANSWRRTTTEGR